MKAYITELEFSIYGEPESVRAIGATVKESEQSIRDQLIETFGEFAADDFLDGEWNTEEIDIPDCSKCSSCYAIASLDDIGCTCSECGGRGTFEGAHCEI